MDFKFAAIKRIKIISLLLDKIAKLKFSIRASILAIVLILMIGTSFLVIGINYFSVDSILVVAAKSHLLQSSGKVSEQIRNYLQPLNSNLLSARRIFSSGAIKPNSPDFMRFLSDLVADNKNLIAYMISMVFCNGYWRLIYYWETLINIFRELN